MLVTDCHCCVIEETWSDIARIAWAGYLNNGRGLVEIDKTQAPVASVHPRMLFRPAVADLPADEAALIQTYNPNKEVVVCIIDASGRHTCRASDSWSTPPSVYARAPQISGALLN